MKILHIQDYGPLAAQMAALLRPMVVSLDTVNSIESAQDALAANTYDLTIWDVDAVEPDAIGRLPELRAGSPNMRILVCGSSTTLPVVAEAVARGADDFILRPMLPDELRIRVQQITAKTSERSTFQQQPVTEFGPLRLNIAQGEASLDGKPLSLTPRERSVLQVLIRACGNVVSKDHIASRVFSLTDDAGPQSIETYVHRLRRKAEHPDIAIQTLRGLGYRLTMTGQ